MLSAKVSAQSSGLAGILVDGSQCELTEDTLTISAAENLTLILAEGSKTGILLEAVSKDTVEIKERFTNIIEYGTLPTGHYLLLNSEKNNQYVHLFVTSSFLQSWWIVPLIFLYLSLLLGGAYFFIQLNNLRNRKKLYDLQLDWTNKLHSDIGADLNGVKMNIELIQRRLQEVDEKVATRFQRTFNILTDVQQRLRFVFDLVNPEKDSLDAALKDLCAFGEQGAGLIQAKFLCINHLVPSDYYMLDIGRINKLYLLLKEAINNSIKYSEAANIQLSISRVGGELHFIVEDNGKGFNMNAEQGTGIQLLRQYAQEGFMLLNIQSTLGEGTVVSISLPKF
ncbi:MAG: sensor histidine kinase [Saprospiraceae bacterium]